MPPALWQLWHDSVTSSAIYFTIEGAYTNQAGDEMVVDGQFTIGHNR